MITKNLFININSALNDTKGRFILLDCTISNQKLIIVNLYAPTLDKKAEQSKFGNCVISQLENYIGHNIIIGEDLNISLDHIEHKISAVPCYSDHLLRLQQMLDVIDIWRILNPNKLRYTRRQRARSGFSQSRLDYFLISCHLQYSVKTIDILPSIKYDHSLLQLVLIIIDEPSRGKGL